MTVLTTPSTLGHPELPGHLTYLGAAHSRSAIPEWPCMPHALAYPLPNQDSHHSTLPALEDTRWTQIKPHTFNPDKTPPPFPQNDALTQQNGALRNTLKVIVLIMVTSGMVTELLGRKVFQDVRDMRGERGFSTFTSMILERQKST